jgi:hypothetical protein
MAPTAIRAGVAALLFALLQEALLRAVFPLPEVLNFDRWRYAPLAPAPDQPAGSLAHASFTWASDPDGFEFVHRLNLYGFRDGEWRLRAGEGRTRVAFVGDSIVEGFSADAESAIPAVFERLAGGLGLAVETLNLGVGGSGFEVYGELIRDAVPLLRPDSLVLVIYGNDLAPLPYDPAWLDEPLEPELSSPWRPRIVHVLREWRRGRRVARRWIERPFSYLAPVPDPRNPWSHESRVRRLEQSVEPSVAEAMRRGRFNPELARWFRLAPRSLAEPVDLGPQLRDLRAYLERYAADLLVAYLPLKNQVSDRYLPFQARYSPAGSVRSLMGEEFQRNAAGLAATCRRLGVGFVDLTPELRAIEAQGRALYWDYDDHPRPEGYRVAAERIFEGWRRGR